MISRFSKSKNVSQNTAVKPTTVKPTTNVNTAIKPTTVKPTTNVNTAVKPTTDVNTAVKPTTDVNTAVKPTTNVNTPIKPTTNVNTPIKPTTNVNTPIKPITTTSNQSENNVIDLDNEIPNYTKMIQNASKTAVDNVTMVAGKFISQQWNELKNTLQKMSIGMNMNSTPTNNTQTGGRRKKTRKYKKTNKKTRKNYKK
jgi:hypothetical protein